MYVQWAYSIGYPLYVRKPSNIHGRLDLNWTYNGQPLDFKGAMGNILNPGSSSLKVTHC